MKMTKRILISRNLVGGFFYDNCPRLVSSVVCEHESLVHSSNKCDICDASSLGVNGLIDNLSVVGSHVTKWQPYTREASVKERDVHLARLMGFSRLLTLYGDIVKFRNVDVKFYVENMVSLFYLGMLVFC